MSEFRETAPSAPAVFYRSYSRRKADGTRESFAEAITRTVDDLASIGGLTKEQRELCLEMGLKQHAFPSGRALWVAGTEWSKKPENFYGYYNCHGGILTGTHVFGRLMDLAMCGTGTGVLLEQELVDALPVVSSKLTLKKVIKNNDGDGGNKSALVVTDLKNGTSLISVGDSRKGWVDAYQALIDLAFEQSEKEIQIELDLSQVRGKGRKLKGFGGVANPAGLQTAFEKIISLLSGAFGRKLTTVEACLLVDEAASAVVAGNLRRSAGIRLFSSDDEDAKNAKQGLYKQDKNGNWSVDPKRESLRLANHTVCYHHRPTLDELKESVHKQFFSGEGAIQFSPEAIARANADLLDTHDLKKEFIAIYTTSGKEAGREFLKKISDQKELECSKKVLDHRILRYSANPCFASGTIVLTKDGYFPIEQLVGKTVEVFDGSKWVEINNFRVTGVDQDVYDVELHDGTVITATGYHTFILSDGSRKELRNLVEGDELMKAEPPTVEGSIQAKAAYLKGFLIGDGTSCKGRGSICKIYAPKLCCTDRLIRSRKEIDDITNKSNLNPEDDIIGITPAGYLRGLNRTQEDLNSWCYQYKHEFPHEVLNWTTKSKADFISGLFDADGTAMDSKNGFGYQLTSISLPFLRGLVTLLRTLGVPSKISLCREAGTKDFGPDRGGVCNVKTAWRLTISQFGAIKLANLCHFERLKSHASKTCSYSIKTKQNKVKSVTFGHIAPEVYCCTVPESHSFTLGCNVLVGQCHEIIGNDFMCNLGEVHLNTIDPFDKKTQHKAFYSTGLMVGSLLQHHFPDKQLQYSREQDPIVAVCLSGLFDFFVAAFGVEWLDWMIKGRKTGNTYKRFTELERNYLHSWKESARQGVADYCEQSGLKMPNRYTAVQPAGSKSLLTGASPGWHPPKSQRFIRRITFGIDDPLVAALRDYGYNVVPAQSARDEEGNLLNDINDPRVHEVLVEIPTEVPWANLPGADAYDLSKIPVESQMGLYMQVQRHYSTHTTSATIEFRENEIDKLAELVYKEIQNDGGYIGVAMLARFDANETFPRLPFEPIDKQTYDRLMAGIKAYRATLPGDVTILDLLKPYDHPDHVLEPQDTACANGACLAKIDQEESMGLSATVS